MILAAGFFVVGDTDIVSAALLKAMRKDRFGVLVLASEFPNDQVVGRKDRNDRFELRADLPSNLFEDQFLAGLNRDLIVVLVSRPRDSTRQNRRKKSLRGAVYGVGSARRQASRRSRAR